MNWFESSSFISYVGRFHPLLVHLPIGFISFWLILEILEIFKKFDFRSAKSVLIFLTAVSAVVSSLLGYFLSLQGDYDAHLLDEHKWGGIWLSVFIIIVFFVYRYFYYLKFYRLFYYGLLFIVFNLLIYTGHHGGSLTHGSEFLSFSNVEENKKVVKAEITDINQALVYNDLVQPIFNQKCISCHNTSKKKGELLLESYEHLMLGGKSGKAVVAGIATKSEIIKVINLEPIEKKYMPPKGKLQLTDDEKVLLAWWIDCGADKHKKVIELKPNAEISVILSHFAKGGSIIGNVASLKKVPAADEAIRKEISSLGLNVLNVAQKENLLDVRCILNKSSWSDGKTKSLLKLKNQIYILDLSGTSITKKSLESIGQLKVLNSLYLQNTAVADQNISELINLKDLQYLNLYNTGISDASVQVLSNLKSLKKLYIWQTKISHEGVLRLKKNLPQTEIVGFDGDDNLKKS